MTCLFQQILYIHPRVLLHSTVCLYYCMLLFYAMQYTFGTFKHNFIGHVLAFDIRTL